MKNKLKFTAVIIAILVMISSFCFAEDQEQTPIEPRTSDVEQINVTDEEAVTTNLENEATAIDEEAEPTVEEPEIYEGDLYIFEDTVNMDKLVDGNVYIIGKDVTITGQVAGNLFVMANNLTIGDETSTTTYNGYVFYNIYALANKATLYSSCYDLYIAGKDITIEDSFYLYRDLKMGAKNANVFATVGRNVDINAKNLNLAKDDNQYATIYGNLNYASAKELDEGTLNNCVMGVSSFIEEQVTSINFSKVIIFSLVFALLSLIILILVITLIIKLILSIIRKNKASKKDDSKIAKTEESEKVEDDKETEKVEESKDTEENKKDEE